MKVMNPFVLIGYQGEKCGYFIYERLFGEWLKSQ